MYYFCLTSGIFDTNYKNVYTLYIAAKDAAGNVSNIDKNPSKSFQFVIDKKAPVISDKKFTIDDIPQTNDDIKITAANIGKTIVMTVKIVDHPVSEKAIVSGIKEIALYDGSDKFSKCDIEWDEDTCIIKVEVTKENFSTGRHDLKLNVKDYNGNVGTVAGKYVASATFNYDNVNYCDVVKFFSTLCDIFK